MQEITSKDNQYLKLARSLNQKKFREKENCLLAEGLRLAEEAAAYATCRVAIFADAALEAPRPAALAAKLEAQGCLCLVAPTHLLEQAASTDNPQGVLVIAALPLQRELAAGQGWYAYADQLSDPGNLGSIMRSARASGCAGLLLSPGCVDPFNPKTVRASMGAVFKLPLLHCTDDADAQAQLARLQAPPLVADAAGQDVRQVGDVLRQPHTWVLGAEAHGPSSTWQQAAKVSLPMTGDTESLNVAAAAAVLFYQSMFAQSS